MAKTFAERIRETQSAVAANIGTLLDYGRQPPEGQNRRHRRKSQTGLAAHLHVSQTTVCRWVEGRHPVPPEHFEAIADYFGTSVVELTSPGGPATEQAS